MTLGSLFDGAGGFPLAGKMAGFTPLWASEIEPFPIRVTTKRFPNMRHLGNITEISGKDIEPVDVITFGSPCQDLSVAGKRAGLGGERSGLFMEAIRIIKEMREETNGKSPTFIVWENVPGAFSSNKGEDFRTVLEEIAKIADGNVTIPRPDKGKWLNAGEILGDGYSIAWRVLDAQFWGVPQRRKRIYLVADFADRRAGRILFERESLSRNTSESRETRERTAAAAENGFGTAGTICLNDQGGQSIDVSYDVTGTLRAEIHGHSPCVMESAAGASCAGFCTEHSAKARGIGYEEETSPTLRAGTVPATVYENHSQDTRYTELNGIAPTVLSAYGTDGNNQPFVVETPYTLKIRSGCDGGGNIVRRLTPLECCRLQGYPDWWAQNLDTAEPTEEDLAFWADVFETHRKATDPAKKPKTKSQIKKWLQDPQTDSAEYKMWGNSLAIPCAYTVLAGIAEELTESKVTK